MNMKNILLVEPDFPFPNKSKNRADLVHKNFIPIGLLKLGALYKDKGNKMNIDHYRNLSPNSEIHLGGIYAALHYNKKKFEGYLRDCFPSK